MENYHSFIELAKSSGAEFISNYKDENIKIIAHHDTDGICSSAILESSLDDKNISYITINQQQIEDKLIEELKKDKNSILFFLDIGSTNIELISKELKNKIYILDHHKPSSTQTYKNIIHINPHFNEIEENIISGSGVVYFFCCGIDAKNKMYANLAVLGAIGDTQEKNGFGFLNNMILQHAVLQKKLSINKELRLYGKNSRSVVKLLEYSTDLEIPNLTNNYKGVVNFLKELRIPLYWKGQPRKWYHLKEYEKDLITQKILELKSDKDPEEITTNSYRFNNFIKRELRYGKEFSTVINACGRLEDFRTAIDALKGKEEAQEKAVMNLRAYKSYIRDALKLFEDLKAENKIIDNGKVVIFDAGDKINVNIIGVIASIIARNKYYPPEIIVCSMANLNENDLKISLRASRDKTEINLAELLQKLVSKFNATAGGHPNAAGAIIKIENKQEFIDDLISSV